ncbi:tyrosine-type recombinase/integrase [Enterococcus faecium]
MQIESYFFIRYEKRLYRKNPINEVVIDYKRESKTIKIKHKFLEDDEYKRLVAFTTSHNKRYSLLFQWLYLTGMRPGEAIALSKDDVHITNNNASVVINGTMMYRERSIADMKKSDSTKTPAGMREIDLPKKR